jgi:membrane protein
VIARLRSWADKAQGWLPVRVLMAFGASQASNYASALAFNAMLSMFPLILGVLAIVGLAIRDPATELRVQSLIIQSFPGTAAPELLQALQGVKQSAGWFGLISIGGLIWSASGIFASMEFVFAEIFGIRQRDLIRQKLMGFVMMVVLVVAIALTLGANTIAAFLPLSWALSFVIGSVVMMALLVLLYRLVPNRSFRVRDVLPGALLAGILIEVLSLAFPLYARLSNGFNTYGKEFALFFLLAAWFYLLSNLILLGAVYNKFRLGQPVKAGLIATPWHEERDVPKPAEAIQQHKEELEATSSDKPEPAGKVGPRPHLAKRAAGYVLVGLAILPRFLRRRGSRKIET